MRNRCLMLWVTRQSSATAGGSERGKYEELSHEIKCAHRDRQRLASAFG